MRIVAVCALHETLIDAVLEGHSKLRSHLLVASVAEIDLLLRQECLGSGRFVNRMATGASNIG
jgi:hypothetical protein